jgi:hypothetical protein
MQSFSIRFILITFARMGATPQDLCFEAYRLWSDPVYCASWMNQDWIEIDF